MRPERVELRHVASRRRFVTQTEMSAASRHRPQAGRPRYPVHVIFDHPRKLSGVARAFVHHFHVFGPGALGQFALHFEFAELMARAARTFVVGVGHLPR